ncbi:MAG: hypothetical protein K2K21_15680 [Lachnospiraceae bacterium]|nr:hypothetical protein [Lachnospiraceae bacterium]
MKVNGIENQAYHEKTSITKSNRKSKGDFYESLSENLNGQTERSTDTNTATGMDANAVAEAAASKAYQYRNIHSAASISGNVNICEGITVCETKYISYQESDHVKTFIQSGYTLMTQVDVSARSVYVEQKMEDGTVKGYDVKMDKLNENVNDPIGQMALEAWEKVKAEGKSEEDDDNTVLTVEEALQKFYEFIEDRIKNGPPKYMIGNSEFSIEGWEKFLESIDGQIDDIKEETKEMIERMKEQQEEEQIQIKAAQSIESDKEIEEELLSSLFNDKG